MIDFLESREWSKKRNTIVVIFLTHRSWSIINCCSLRIKSIAIQYILFYDLKILASLGFSGTPFRSGLLNYLVLKRISYVDYHSFPGGEWKGTQVG